MQKQITAKRGQIDALQSKIKFLEEAMTNATKVKTAKIHNLDKCVPVEWLDQILTCQSHAKTSVIGVNLP